MLDLLLRVNVVSGGVIWSFFGLSAFALAYLLARRPARRFLAMSAGAIIVGGLAALLIWFLVVRVFNVFGTSLGLTTYLWLGATCVGVCLAFANLWNSGRLRKTLAVACVVVFLVTGALGVNAGYGLNRTLGSVLGISTDGPLALPPLKGAPGEGSSSQPLWKSWKPPADMPEKGTTGSQVIPNTVSGFSSRPAGIYLPPAALVPNPPALPLVVLMMGQPGAPDPSYVAETLDRMAARTNGLAPIVIVADQLGDPSVDPLCLDTAKYGNAETFLTQDVVNWARANLTIIQNPAYWTVAGYSNGGQCAISLFAKHPKLWSNVIDISGEEFPGSESVAANLQEVFGGDMAAYDTQKPVNLLANRHFEGASAVFTVGSNDADFIPGVRRVAAAAEAAGMTVTYWESPDGGHVLPALTDGLNKAFDVLYPRLGLSATATGGRR